ncbi:MAG: iron-containing redox enzyme family protein [Rhodobacteraceae bacterium]|nr:iron-containing redox enzyme family protein [Paracoccaceae bacterium]
MAKLKSQKAFYAALEAARSPIHSGGHPFSKAWSKGQLTLDQVGRWAIQHFYYIDAIPQQFAYFISRLDHLLARRHMLENLIGEEMPHLPPKRHPDLLVKFAKACGVSKNDLYKAEEHGRILPSTRAMRAWIWELVAFRHLAEGAAGIMVALEGQLPTLYPDFVKTMKKQGLTDDDMEFFHVHIVNDVEHAHVGLEITADYANTPELQERAVAAVRASTEMRWRMLDGIYDSIVARGSKSKRAA